MGYRLPNLTVGVHMYTLDPTISFSLEVMEEGWWIHGWVEWNPNLPEHFGISPSTTQANSVSRVLPSCALLLIYWKLHPRSWGLPWSLFLPVSTLIVYPCLGYGHHGYSLQGTEDQVLFISIQVLVMSIGSMPEITICSWPPAANPATLPSASCFKDFGYHSMARYDLLNGTG